MTWRGSFLQRGCTPLPVPFDRQLVVNTDTVANQEFGKLRVSAPGSPIHEGEVVRPAGVRLAYRDTGRVGRTGLEHGPEGIGHAAPRCLVEDVVLGLVDVQRHVPVEEQLYGRPTPLHADHNLEQLCANAVQHRRLISQNLL